MNEINSLKLMYAWPVDKPKAPLNEHGFFDEYSQRGLSKILNANMKLVVELGSWLGASTRFILDHAPNAIVIAVDHWEGSFEHQNKAGLKEVLRNLYPTFLVNCWDYRDRLIPMKKTTLEGLDEIHSYGLIPDFFYVDASHEYDDVIKDLNKIYQYFPFAQIAGDDWIWGSKKRFPVQKAVRNVAKMYNLQIKHNGNFWILKRSSNILSFLKHWCC